VRLQKIQAYDRRHTMSGSVDSALADGSTHADKLTMHAKMWTDWRCRSCQVTMGYVQRLW